MAEINDYRAWAAELQELARLEGFENNKALAKCVGVHPSTIGRWFRGDMLPDEGSWRDLARCLNISEERLAQLGKARAEHERIGKRAQRAADGGDGRSHSPKRRAADQVVLTQKIGSYQLELRQSGDLVINGSVWVVAAK